MAKLRIIKREKEELERRRERLIEKIREEKERKKALKVTEKFEDLYIDAKKRSYSRFLQKIEEDDKFLRSKDRKKFLLQKVGNFCCCLRK